MWGKGNETLEEEGPERKGVDGEDETPKESRIRGCEVEDPGER